MLKLVPGVPWVEALVCLGRSIGRGVFFVLVATWHIPIHEGQPKPLMQTHYIGRSRPAENLSLR